MGFRVVLNSAGSVRKSRSKDVGSLVVNGSFKEWLSGLLEIVFGG